MTGAKKSQKVKENLSVLESLSNYIEVRPFDKFAAVIYGDIRSDLERRGEIIGAYDLLIAAQALSLNLILVTNNEREFSRVQGLKIENWTKSTETQ